MKGLGDEYRGCEPLPHGQFADAAPATPEEIYLGYALTELGGVGRDPVDDHPEVVAAALDMSPGLRNNTGWGGGDPDAWERIGRRYYVYSISEAQLGLDGVVRASVGLLVPRSRAVVDPYGAPEPIRLVATLTPGDEMSTRRLRLVAQGPTSGSGHETDPRKNQQTVAAGIAVEQSVRGGEVANLCGEVLRHVKKTAAIRLLLAAAEREPRESIAESGYWPMRRLTAVQARLLGDFVSHPDLRV
jgi:hypothetical protein